MQFCWFSIQKVASWYGPCSPNNLAVWCFLFNRVRIAEKWYSAVRPRDTHHPSTGNACRPGFMHTYHRPQRFQVPYFHKKNQARPVKTSYFWTFCCSLITNLSITVKYGDYENDEPLSASESVSCRQYLRPLKRSCDQRWSGSKTLLLSSQRLTEDEKQQWSVFCTSEMVSEVIFPCCCERTATFNVIYCIQHCCPSLYSNGYRATDLKAITTW